MNAKNSKRNVAQIVAVIVASMMAISIVYLIVFQAHAFYRPTSPDLNLIASDINYVVNSSLYTPVLINSTTIMPKSLQSEGYLKTSVSLFNLTNASPSYKSKYPGVITSVLYYMSGNKAAQTAFQSMIYSNNQNQSVTGYTYKGKKIMNYTFSGNAVELYMVRSVAFFNVSPALLNLTLPYYMPDYQYTTLFAYRNFTGSVIINSYTPSAKYANDSIDLAELIINKIYSHYS
ncbi:MAG: hypothetical protein M1465_00285 [Candidatus Marsarchaeota archaeon]|jgi:hypothetical protein|nr:hypothetical protein [Candidatus Marsarchaeota archaeon]